MLDQMLTGERAKVIEITGGKQMVRKMMSLGIKTGAAIELLHHRGKSIVVRSNGTRIAIGASIARQLTLAPLVADKPNRPNKTK